MIGTSKKVLRSSAEMDPQPADQGSRVSDMAEGYFSGEERDSSQTEDELYVDVRMEEKRALSTLGESDSSPDRADEGSKKPGPPMNDQQKMGLKTVGNVGISRVSVICSPKEPARPAYIPSRSERGSSLSIEDDLSDDEIYSPADYFHIKEEEISSDERDLTDDDDVDEPPDDMQTVRIVDEPLPYGSVRTKEEPDPYDGDDTETDFLTVYIKDEPDSPRGESDLYTQSAYIMVESESSEENSKDGVIYPPTEYIFASGYDKWTNGAGLRGARRKANRLSADKRAPVAEGLFPCSECQKCFDTNLDLLKHRVVHTTKELTCTECGKSLSTKSSLVRHYRSHIGNDLFACAQCGKCFTYRANLVAHQKTHSGQKPYACSVCGKRYTVKTSLVRHQLIHEGVKPYSCSECGKAFTLNSTLLKHQMTHTGEKPFSCAECGKRFSLKSLLVRHQMLHSGEKPHACPDCGKQFVCKSDVVKHQKTHTGERPHVCSECGKSFTKKSSLRKHTLIHTRKKAFAHEQSLNRSIKSSTK